MATVYFPSQPGGDVVDVEFLKPDGTASRRMLLVDSGFTGQSAIILGTADSIFSHAAAPASQAGGALSGSQTRGVVVCQVTGLSVQHTLIAIFTDLTTLALPSGVEGMVGLQFLRQFQRWGAEQSNNGDWRFFLCDA
jgi:hypothetical protein